MRLFHHALCSVPDWFLATVIGSSLDVFVGTTIEVTASILEDADDACKNVLLPQACVYMNHHARPILAALSVAILICWLALRIIKRRTS